MNKLFILGAVTGLTFTSGAALAQSTTIITPGPAPSPPVVVAPAPPAAPASPPPGSLSVTEQHRSVQPDGTQTDSTSTTYRDVNGGVTKQKSVHSITPPPPPPPVATTTTTRTTTTTTNSD
jgi:hypothetical protein